VTTLPASRWLDALYLGSPLLLAASGVLVLGGLIVGKTLLWVTLIGACLLPVATATTGVATAVALVDLRRSPDAGCTWSAFWMAALPASAGLLSGIWWWFCRRPSIRRAAVAAPVQPTLPSVFSDLPVEQQPTVQHDGPVPLARRRPARLESIKSPLRPLGAGTLAPTVHMRRRRKK